MCSGNFHKKLQHNSCALLDKAEGLLQQTFHRVCLRKLLELLMVFSPVRKSSENVYISIKLNLNTKSLNYLKIKINYKKLNTMGFLKIS